MTTLTRLLLLAAGLATLAWFSGPIAGVAADALPLADQAELMHEVRSTDPAVKQCSDVTDLQMGKRPPKQGAPFSQSDGGTTMVGGESMGPSGSGYSGTLDPASSARFWYEMRDSFFMNCVLGGDDLAADRWVADHPWQAHLVDASHALRSYSEWEHYRIAALFAHMHSGGGGAR